MKSNGCILIADGGSTKVEWCLIHSNSSNIRVSLETEGFNAIMATPKVAKSYFSNVRKSIGEEYNPSEIYYYGAGCATPEICARISHEIGQVWEMAMITVDSDMLAACRSLLGDEPGIACILGTGSNSALYDGHEIKDNIPPLGFILGDEGSGTALGKRLLGDIFKNIAPQDIRSDFLRLTGLTKDVLLDKTYRSEAPNKFLASFVPFIKKHLLHPYMMSMTEEIFTSFFLRNVLPYEGSGYLPVHLTGSVAFHFSQILKKVGADLGLNIGRFSSRPMPDLINYHNNLLIN